MVRPDGRITLPLLGDMVAAGLTPSALRERIRTAARNFVEQPNVTVTVRSGDTVVVL
jgi:polysaccharide export outer membrane protein